jgi:hypothetical protein
MNTNALARATVLSDADLLIRIQSLAGQEREATAELVAHLAVLDARPSLYTALGHGSLFSYCTHVLRLSEDSTCSRIDAARACRRFPAILDGLASGAMSLSSVRLLHPHLTRENHQAILARAFGRSRREVEALVAELAPRPDVPSTVRKLPAATSRTVRAPAALVPSAGAAAISAELALASSEPSPLVQVAPPPPPARRPIIETTSPERYRVQFTIGKEGHDRLRRLQALLRREIPDGDPGAIVERALTLLLEKVEKRKLGAAASPRATAPIRPGTDQAKGRRVPLSRTIARQVKRAVWERDGGRCAFVSREGHRCPERTFLEFHHRQPYAHGGPATVENIALRCRRHNQYEAEIDFGPANGFAQTPARDRRATRSGAATSPLP